MKTLAGRENGGVIPKVAGTEAEKDLKEQEGKRVGVDPGAKVIKPDLEIYKSLGFQKGGSPWDATKRRWKRITERCRGKNE